MQGKIETDRWDQRHKGVPLLGGLASGVVSFLLGYLAFLGIAAGTGSGLNSNDIVGGAFITVGFLLVALVGTSVFPMRGEGSFVGPDRNETLVFGIVYPCACSTAGVIAGELLCRPEFEAEAAEEQPGDATQTDDGAETG